MAKLTTLLSETEQKAKTWASICTNPDSTPFVGIKKIVKGRLLRNVGDVHVSSSSALRVSLSSPLIL